MNPPKPSVPTGRFYVPALDGLRVFAFLAVWGGHALAPLLSSATGPWAKALVFSGIYGVPLFFVLSAFLITRLLLLEKERNGRVDLKAYYVRRTLRIWPLYFLVVGAGLAILALQGHPVREGVLALLTFTTNIRGGTPELLGPLWSVSVEEQFYLVWPLVLALVPARRLPTVCGVMAVVALLGRCAIVHRTGSCPAMLVSTVSQLDSLAFGTLLALNLHRIPSLSRARWGLLTGLCVASLVVEMRAFPLVPSLRTAVAYTAVPLLCAGIVALALGARESFLARPKVAALGRLTFGLYVWHMFPLLLLRPTTPAGYLGCFLTAWVIAAASYYGVERPFLSLKTRFERVQTRTA